MCKDTLSKELLVIDDDESLEFPSLEHSGNIFTFYDKAQVVVRSPCIPSCQPSFKVHLFKGSTDKLRIGFG